MPRAPEDAPPRCACIADHCTCLQDTLQLSLTVNGLSANEQYVAYSTLLCVGLPCLALAQQQHQVRC